MTSELLSALLLLKANFGDVQGRVLAQGTPVFLRLTENIRARAMKTGSTVNVQVGAPVRVGSCDVVPAGAPAEMLVIQSNSATIAGQPDRLKLRAMQAKDVTGAWIPLEGEYSLEGDDRMLESVGAAATVSCLFLFMKGDPVVIAAGSGWTAFVGKDLPYEPCP